MKAEAAIMNISVIYAVLICAFSDRVYAVVILPLSYDKSCDGDKSMSVTTWPGCVKYIAVT